MGKYASISVPVEVKKYLEIMKGDKKWGEFLTEMLDLTQSPKNKKPLRNKGEGI